MKTPVTRDTLIGLAAALNIRVKHHEWSGYSFNDGIIYVEPDAEPWVLAHELAHATGFPLRRRSMLAYASRLQRVYLRGEYPYVSFEFWHCVHIEEAISDKVATAITGGQRERYKYGTNRRPYLGIQPNTRAAHYVNVKAAEAVTFLHNLRKGKAYA